MAIHGRRQREEMVSRQIEARGVSSPEVLAAMRRVKREGYVPSYLGEFAYEDTPLPIEEEQTISQPYIVAYMVEAMDLRRDDRVLEIGTGSGYAAAVLAEIAGEVYTIERHAALADRARERLRRDGYENVHVRHGDGTLGWPEAAPFDAIVVAAGGPRVPDSLREQLALGGRLVIPVGDVVGLQKLLRVTRLGHDRWTTEEIGDVRFVPLVGEEGWCETLQQAAPAARPSSLAKLVASAAEPFDDVAGVDVAPLLRRVGDARVVLLGESTHGTSEFHALRAAITRALVERAGFTIVAVEADWPDAACLDHHARGLEVPVPEWQAFDRFPTWMWGNEETRAFVDWLARFNAGREPERRVRFAGLDLYGMYHSIAAVLSYLDVVDPELARLGRERYGCLTPWQSDPAAYGRAALTGAYRTCQTDAVHMLQEMLSLRLERLRLCDERLFEAIEDARLVADAEAYYRVMYLGSRESWNLRDRHMFGTLVNLLDYHGPHARAVVWAHNSHVGDSAATEMSARGEFNIGHLCRERFREQAYAIGLATDHGSVAASSHWDGPLEIKRVRPSHPESHERVFHETGLPGFLLPLRAPRAPRLREEFADSRLERAIGVIYRPETERASHYFHAVLPRQFDEVAWIDETRALHPLEAGALPGTAGAPRGS